jgi:hypothetical protein
VSAAGDVAMQAAVLLVALVGVVAALWRKEG